MIPVSCITIQCDMDKVSATVSLGAECEITPMTTPGQSFEREALFKALAYVWNVAYGDINRLLITLHAQIAETNKYAPSGCRIPTDQLEELIRATSSAALVNYIKTQNFTK